MIIYIFLSYLEQYFIVELLEGLIFSNKEEQVISRAENGGEDGMKYEGILHFYGYSQGRHEHGWNAGKCKKMQKHAEKCMEMSKMNLGSEMWMNQGERNTSSFLNGPNNSFVENNPIWKSKPGGSEYVKWWKCVNNVSYASHSHNRKINSKKLEIITSESY